MVQILNAENCDLYLCLMETNPSLITSDLADRTKAKGRCRGDTTELVCLVSLFALSSLPLVSAPPQSHKSLAALAAPK